MRTTSPSQIGAGHHDDHETMHLAERTVARTSATMLGIFLLALGAGGLVNPGYAGMHLNLAHTLVLIVSGAASFYIGLAGSSLRASLFCLGMGAFYTLLAAAGYFLGAEGEHTVAGISHGTDTHLLRIIPGVLEVAIRDHILHIGIGGLYLAVGIFGWFGSDDEH